MDFLDVYFRKYVNLKFQFSSVTQSCLTICHPMDCSLPGFFCPWDFPGKNAGVDCHFLLQGIFLTQESNPGVPHCRQTLYHLSHHGVEVYYKDSCLLTKSWPTLATLWTVDYQAPLSMGFPRQEYWSTSHFFLQGIFLTQESNLHLLYCQADSLPLSHQGSPQENMILA